MKINPISVNNQYRKQNFKGIITPDATVLNKVINEKDKPVYDSLSDEKNIDVWILKNAAVAGGGYTALIKDKKSVDIMKTISCKDNVGEVEKFRNRILLSLVYVNAPSNMVVSAFLKNDENANKSNPQLVDKVCKQLDATGNPTASNAWKDNFRII